MTVLINTLLIVAGVVSLLVTVFLYYHLQTAACWLTFSAVVLFALAGCLQWQNRIWIKQAETPEYQRAYLGINSSFVEDFKRGAQALAVITFKNAGKSPASRVMMNACFSIQPPNSPLDWNKVEPFDPKDGGSYLLPGESQVKPIKFPLEATGELFDSLVKEEVVVVIYGRISYQDVGGNPHLTEICRFYRPSTNTLVVCHSNNREVY